MILELYKLMGKVGITSHQDKVLHAIVGFVVGAISMYFVGVWSIAIVLAAAIGKEIYDKFVKGTYMDLMDALATIGGGWIGIVIAGSLGA